MPFLYLLEVGVGIEKQQQKQSEGGRGNAYRGLSTHWVTRLTAGCLSQAY